VKKSGAKRIAERYVKALFDVAQSSNALDVVEKDLNALGKALEDSADFQHFLTNPLLSHASRAEAMLEILEKMRVNQLSRQFIGMLIHQKRLGILPEIIALFSEWASSARGELRGELIAAAPLKPYDIEMVGQRLGKAYGKKIKLNVRQDPALLGGVVVKIGSVQFDGSLAGKMRRLKIALQVA